MKIGDWKEQLCLFFSGLDCQSFSHLMKNIEGSKHPLIILLLFPSLVFLILMCCCPLSGMFQYVETSMGSSLT